VTVAALEGLQEPQQARVRGDELAVAALEELTPLGGDRIGILEVVLEQETGVAGVQAVDVVRAHRLCCSNRDEAKSGIP
jgi:nickel-dependent lactate racemase